MTIRSAVNGDVERILEIYENARRFMRRSGNRNQWINGYPDREQLAKDMDVGAAFVCEEAGQLLAVFTLIPGQDPTYARINGAWLDNAPYATLHRVASAGIRPGMMDEIVYWAFEKYGNLRGDTHRDNLPMQKAFERNGFRYCGIIWVRDGSERMAYQKID